MNFDLCLLFKTFIIFKQEELIYAENLFIINRFYLVRFFRKKNENSNQIDIQQNKTNSK
jgi:hypothetical protein